MLGRLNCTEVRRTGRYPSHDAEFDAFYFYKDPNEHTELLTSLGRFAMLAALVMVVLGWAHVAELWDRKGTSVAVIFTSFLAAYAHNDLSSAFGDQLFCFVGLFFAATFCAILSKSHPDDALRVC